MVNKSNTQKVTKGISSQTIVTIVLGAVEVITFSIMSRLLTQKDFGYYAALSAVLIVFNSFAETGIGAALIQRKDVNQSFINNAFTLSLLFGIAISSILFLLSDYLAQLVVDETMSTPLKLMSLTLVCYCMTSPYVSILYRRLKFLTVGLINLISLIITSIVAIILAAKGFGYYAIITKTVASAVLTLILSAIISRVHFSIEWKYSVIKSIWRYSGWLMASVVFRNFAQQSDKLLMSKLLSVSALGAYNRPKEFINQIASKLNNIFDTALFPVLSSIQDNIQSLQHALIKSMYFMNLFSIMLTLAFFFNAELIIRIFFGNDWLNLIGIFQVLSLALVFNVDGRLADCFLRSLALTKAQFYFRVIETIIKFTGVIYGSHYGIYGVSIAVVFSNFIMIFVKIYYIALHIKLNGSIILKTIIEAWKPLIILLPILIILTVFLPHSVMGDIVMLFSYVFLSLGLFLFLPQLIGKEYHQEIHQKIMSFLINKFGKR